MPDTNSVGGTISPFSTYGSSIFESDTPIDIPVRESSRRVNVQEQALRLIRDSEVNIPETPPSYLEVDMISIPHSEYLELQKQANWLSALNAAGLSNWPGLEWAQEAYRDQQGEDYS